MRCLICNELLTELELSFKTSKGEFEDTCFNCCDQINCYNEIEIESFSKFKKRELNGKSTRKDKLS